MISFLDLNTNILFLFKMAGFYDDEQHALHLNVAYSCDVDHELLRRLISSLMNSYSMEEILLEENIPHIINNFLGGKTPLMWSVSVQTGVKFPQLLLDKGADHTIVDSEGLTAKDMAINCGPYGENIVHILEQHEQMINSIKPAKR